MPWDWNMFQSVTGFFSSIVFLIGMLAIGNFAPFRAVGVYPADSEWLDRNGVDKEILKVCSRAQSFLWILLFTNLFLGGYSTELYFLQVDSSRLIRISGMVMLLLKATGLALFITFMDVRLTSIASRKWLKLFLLKLTPLSLACLAISILSHLDSSHVTSTGFAKHIGFWLSLLIYAWGFGGTYPPPPRPR
jgi:NADH:ubiquinone oxidoreductase subunit H